MQKRLYCSPDKKICGVCGGLADYFGIDPTLMRFIVAEVAFFTAIVPAFLIYLIMAIVMPQAPADYVPGNVNVKHIYKSSDKKIAGVCGGLAEYFNIDPTLMRLAFVALFILVGNGLYTYLVGAIFMPQPLQTADPQAYGPAYGYHDANGYSDPNDYNQAGYANPQDYPNAGGYANPQDYPNGGDYTNGNDYPPQQ